MDTRFLPSSLRGTAIHIRGCRDADGNNPYWKLGADADGIEAAADEIDRLRATVERRERLLRASLKFVLDPNIVQTVSLDWTGTRDELADKISAALTGAGEDT